MTKFPYDSTYSASFDLSKEKETVGHTIGTLTLGISSLSHSEKLLRYRWTGASGTERNLVVSYHELFRRVLRRRSCRTERGTVVSFGKEGLA